MAIQEESDVGEPTGIQSTASSCRHSDSPSTSLFKNRRGFLTALGGTAVAVLAGCLSTSELAGSVSEGATSFSQPTLIDVLTNGSGRWFHEDLIAPVAVSPGIPPSRTHGIWHFQLNPDVQGAGFNGIGVRQSILQQPNGTIVDSSGITGNLGAHFSWRLDGYTLSLRYDTWTGTRDETAQLQYDSTNDGFAVTSSEYGSGTWIRLENSSLYNDGRFGSGSGVDYSGYQTLTDETGIIRIEAPVEWTDIADQRTQLGPTLAVSPDNAAYNQSYTVPGVRVHITNQLQGTPDQVLASWGTPGCSLTGAGTFDNGRGLTGPYRQVNACGGTPTAMLHIVAQPPNRRYMVLVELQLVGERDNQASRHVLNSLQVNA